MIDWIVSRFFRKNNSKDCGLAPANNPPKMPDVLPSGAEISVGQVWTMQSDREVFYAEVLALKDGWVQYKLTVTRTTPFRTETGSCITDRTVESFVGIYKLLRDTTIEQDN